jgi:hypothetical protein
MHTIRAEFQACGYIRLAQQPVEKHGKLRVAKPKESFANFYSGSKHMLMNMLISKFQNARIIRKKKQDSITNLCIPSNNTHYFCSRRQDRP